MSNIKYMKFLCSGIFPDNNYKGILTSRNSIYFHNIIILLLDKDRK